MDPRKPMTGMGVIILAIAMAGAALLAGVGVWYWQYSANTALAEDLAVAEARIAELETKLAELESSAASETDDAGETGDEDATGTSPDSSEEPPVGSSIGKTTKEFAYIADISEVAGRYTWVLDHAQLLTGAEAVAAATAHGDESPPPNDYYIVNDNPKLRTYPVEADAKVVVAFGSPNDTMTMVLGQYYDVWLNDTDGNGKNTPFWVTIENGKVTGASEFWSP